MPDPELTNVEENTLLFLLTHDSEYFADIDHERINAAVWSLDDKGLLSINLTCDGEDLAKKILDARDNDA